MYLTIGASRLFHTLCGAVSPEVLPLHCKILPRYRHRRFRQEPDRQRLMDLGYRPCKACDRWKARLDEQARIDGREVA